MKTLIELGIEPKVGMVTQNVSSNLKHNIISINTDYRGNTYITTVSEYGSKSCISKERFIDRYLFVGFSKQSLQDLFTTDELEYDRIIEAKKLIGQLENLWKKGIK